MNRLSVNIDHIATVRQARQTDEPDPIWAAAEAELGGADGITFHLREDRRHISDRDAELLRRTVAGNLNMEMSMNPGIAKIALALKPDQITLVPEKREELTTEGGLDVKRLRKRVQTLVAKMRKSSIPVTAFIEPDPDQIQAAADVGCEAVEIWTGGYAHAKRDSVRLKVLHKLDAAIDTAIAANLHIRAGHGLTYRNITEIARLGGFEEFNIGHSIVARATLVGMRAAVQEMKRLLESAKTDMLIFHAADGAE
ncbi:MAG: pyridoxine 5'-phosphate synthase [Phycisphaerae bacterium]